MNDMIILKIKERKYGMRKMPPLQAAPFGLRVSKIVSKILTGNNAVSTLVSLKKKLGAGGGLDVNSSETASLGVLILSLLANIDAEELSKIFKDAIAYEVYCGDKKLSDDNEFDLHFQQYPGDMYIVCAWATYNHVSDFFSGLGDGMSALIPNSGNNRSDRV